MAAAPNRLIKTPGRPSAGVPRTLRELRVDRGWNLQTLADRAGLNVATVSQIERGKLVAEPHHLQALSDAVGLTLQVAVMVVHWEPAR